MHLTSHVLSLGLALVGGAQALKYGYNHDVLRKDSEVVASAFPDVDKVKLLSPAFTSQISQPGFQNGTQNPTTDAEAAAFLRKLAKKNKWMTYNEARFTSEEGRGMPYIELSSSKVGPKSKKLRVWIQGGVHGNEPAGDQGVYAFLAALDADQKWASTLLKKLDITILPRYNADGIYYFQRELASNADPNRDHIRFEQQQTRDIRALFNSVNPHIAIDMHEYTAWRQYGLYVHASDGLVAAAKNPNIHPNIRALSEDLFAKNIGDAMVSQGLRWEPYMESEVPVSDEPGYKIIFAEATGDARIGRNAMGLTQCVTFLLETRGIGLGNMQFQRRVASAFTMIKSILTTATENFDEVYSTITDSIAEFKDSRENIVVTHSSELVGRNFTFVDVTDGAVVQVPIQWRPTVSLTPKLTRARPEGYFIPRPWAKVAERLRGSGVEVKTLKEGWKGSVESFTIDSISFDAKYYEGAVLAKATTTSTTRSVELPPGSFYVTTRQKNAALAMVALEPENVDSYVSTNVIPVSKGDEYPIFRTFSS